MTPDELARLHPCLYHLTTPESVEGIRRRGLRPTLDLLDLYEANGETRSRVLARRPAEVPLDHPRHGQAMVNDNSPLSDAGLLKCLEDGLTPDEWRGMLNARVFFWPSRADLAGLAGARANAARPRAVLVVDTRRLAEAHGARMEIAPINTGNTRRKPTPRGHATFAPLIPTDFAAWRRRRKLASPDRIREVTVRGAVPDIDAFILDVERLGA